MSLQHSRASLLLLVLVLGITVLWTAVGVDGPGTNAVQQYAASEVTYDEELVLTDVETGEERRGADVSTVNVDENVVCLPSHTRECALASKERDGEIDSSGVESAFRYAYLDDGFYRITSTLPHGSGFEYERTDASEAFAGLAVDSDRASDAEREAIEEGEVVTTRPQPHANRLVEHEGRYYTILQTGTKVYGDSGSFCSSGGDDFCDRADRERRGHWIPRLGLGALGVLGTVVGGRGLLRSYRSE